ncbi:MAG TPA: sulfatase, partial [Vicinamibacteria bacterium]|nr:sulfatase [Vicinamibacteria bacterium]
LAVRDGLLRGRATTSRPVLHVERTTEVDGRDQLHAVEVRIRVSEGANLKAEVSGAEKIDPRKPLQVLQPFEWALTTPLVAGEEMRTYTLKYPRPVRASQVRRLFLQPTDVKGAAFEIESVRMIFRQEYLAGIPSGIGFQGMSDIYRESIVARAPETLSIPLELPLRPSLEISLGTVDDTPVRFRVAVGDRTLVEQTLTTPYRWEERYVDLADFAGQAATLTLSLQSEHDGAIGIWGSPVVRNRDPARPGGSPKGVIVLWADTIRRDHLDAYGYERETAPVLKRFASEGVLFENNFSQATWTKVSTPSLLTSLYPSTHGVKNFSDYLPSAAATLAEVYRGAGYATVSFASNLFTAQFTNLHQGFEELHEDGSLQEVGSSKTSREFVDRFTRWLERHRDVPFIAFLHLYDPHDPFEPRPPYDRLWADPANKEEHVANQGKVRAFIQDPLGKLFGMPSRDELLKAGLDPEAYAAHDKDWYDGSIRGMDVEIERIFDRLRELGLDRDTLIVFAGDHGEEFLEHGNMFHGQSVYGELTRVPLIFRWPDGVAQGVSVENVTETIDVMPTLLALSKIAPPEGMQGQSLVPLLTGKAGEFRDRPAISEKAATKAGEGAPWPADTESYSIVDSGFKLIHHRTRKDGTPEYELFDAMEDPLDRNDISSLHPDQVKRLSELLDGWYKMANAARLPADSENTSGLSQEQLERLRSLGYIR